MRMLKRVFRSPVTSVLLFLIAAILLLPGVIGAARAVLNYYSSSFITQVETDKIGVSLLENGEKISWRDFVGERDNKWNESRGTLLGNMLTDGEEVQLGKAYEEKLSVQNSGSIDEYVRVTIYKYWTDEDGMKLRELSPSLIGLNLVNLDSEWLIDEGSSTPERTVLYYSRVLPSGGTTPLFADSLTIDTAIADKVTQTETVETKDGNTYRTVTTTYDYDGVSFHIEANVDAVQTHNARDAIWSAWGHHVSITDGRLTLEEG